MNQRAAKTSNNKCYSPRTDMTQVVFLEHAIGFSNPILFARCK